MVPFTLAPLDINLTYFKSGSNQFGFGLILKRKDKLSISDNSDGSGTSVFSSTVFQKWPKSQVL